MPLSRLTEDFADYASRCVTVEALFTHFACAAQALGCPYYAILDSRYLLGKRPQAVGFVRYPAIWQDVFLGRKLYRRCPVLLASRRCARPFSWCELTSLIPVAPDQIEILSGAAGEGVTAGFTVASTLPGEPLFCCTFVRSQPWTPGFAERQCMWVIGGYAIEALRRLSGWQLDPKAIPHLSPRELDCLHWIAAGKTDEEIARILGIGTTTVRTYVTALLRKFEVYSRTQLPTRALQAGLIGFDDAIPHG